jgi:hypothetical protein
MPFEDSSLVNYKTRCSDVSVKLAWSTDLNLFSGIHVACDLTLDHHRIAADLHGHDGSLAEDQCFLSEEFPVDVAIDLHAAEILVAMVPMGGVSPPGARVHAVVESPLVLTTADVRPGSTPISSGKVSVENLEARDRDERRKALVQFSDADDTTGSRPRIGSRRSAFPRVHSELRLASRPARTTCVWYFQTCACLAALKIS